MAKTNAGSSSTQDKCRVCKTVGKKSPKLKLGNALGSGDDLGRSILWHCGSSKKKMKKNKHHFYSGPNTIEAHHIICSESMKKNQKPDPEWKKIVNICGYDINCWQNGIFLPSNTQVACNLNVPIHFRHHGGGQVGGTSYPLHVITKITDPIKTMVMNGKHKYCEDPDEILKLLYKRSKALLKKIENFTATITSDGHDYENDQGNGCGNAKDITSKTGRCKLRNFSPRRYHNFGRYKPYVKYDPFEVGT